MKVKLLTLAAGPGGVIQPGQVVDLPEAMAQALVNGGYAVAVKRGSAPETAAIEPPENAARPAPTKRGAGKRG